MADPFLTDDEIERLTKPLTQGAARCKFFRRLGIKVDPRPDGQPIVGRAEFEAARLSKNRQPLAVANDGNVITPDFGELRRLQERKRGPRAA